MANDEVAGGDPILAAKENDITVGTTAPPTPTNGHVWIDTTSVPYLIKVYESGAFVTKSPRFAVPAFTLTTSNAAGTSLDAVRSDASLALFDATVPTTMTPGAAAAAGSAAFAARRDHTHGGLHIEGKVGTPAGGAYASAVTWTASFGSTPAVAACAHGNGVSGTAASASLEVKSTSGATLAAWTGVAAYTNDPIDVIATAIT